MLATPEDKTAETMSFISLTAAFAVAHWSSGAQNIMYLLLKRFLKMVTVDRRSNRC
jgi:hypothetical protein